MEFRKERCLTIPVAQRAGTSGIGPGHRTIAGLRLAEWAEGAFRKGVGPQLALLTFMLLGYGFLLCVSGHSTRNSGHNLLFNSMLDHLMRGQFDVDPRTVGIDGFLRGGRVYAYFGIFCALLRLPLWAVGRMDLNVTMWSCLAAVTLAAMVKVRTALLVLRRGLPQQGAKLAFAMTSIYLLLGGGEVANLKARVYEEAIFWAAAFGAIFVYCVVKGLLNGFDVSTRIFMALCAGLALLTRVSTGLGLILAFVLLLVVLVVQDARTTAGGHTLTSSRPFLVSVWRRFAVPLAVLGVFVLLTGVVNYYRWGNPATFAPYRDQIAMAYFPTGAVARMDTYGLFSFRRLPIGLVYYFLPVWVLHGSGDHPWVEIAETRYMWALELPPSSALLTDLFAFGLMAFLVFALLRSRSFHLPQAKQWLAVAIGLAVPCILMLTYIYMAQRYRIEFDPEIDLLAFLGLYAIAANAKLGELFIRHRRWMMAALAISVVASFTALLLLDLSAPGYSEKLLQNGVVNYYLSHLHGAHLQL